MIMSSCGSSYSKVASDVGYSNPSSVANVRQQENIITESLFNPKESTISEEDIQRLLDGKIKVPDSVRVAVLNLNATFNHYNRYYIYNSEEEMKLQQQNFEILRDAMMSSDRTHKYF